MPPDLHYTSANGLRFAYYEEGSGPLVLLLHGFPDTPHTWAEIQPPLAAAGYRVVAPFMRGYPPSAVPTDGDYSAVTLAGDVLALIAALGADDAVVIGHDWGAFATYAAANRDPQRIRKLVTIAIPHPRALKPNLRTLWKSRHFVTFQFRPWAVASLTRHDFAGVAAIYRRWSPNWSFNEADLAPVKQALRAPGGVQGALGYYWSFRRDAFGRHGAAARRLLQARTTVPTLAFFGAKDGALDQSNIEATRSCFTGVYELVCLPNVGHFLHREATPVFLARTRAFLEQ